MFDTLVDAISGSDWSYLVLFGVAALDAVFPVVPSETAAIVAGIVASRGELDVRLAILSAAAGAILGDCTSYGLGRTLGRPAADRLFRGEQARRRLQWAEEQLGTRGPYLLVVARFVPGGRTALTFTAGIVHWSIPRFALFDAIAGVLWGSYAVLLGYFGGRVFEDNPWYALALAGGIAVGITVAVEGVRRARA